MPRASTAAATGKTPSEAVASDLSQFVSGKAAVKDFDILEASGRTPKTPASMGARYISSTSPYPSIRAANPVSPGSWQCSLLLALQTQLPQLPEIRRAFALYREYKSWSVPAINCAQLAAEIDELELILRQGLFLQVDPAWVALLFIVMATGAVSAFLCGNGSPDEGGDSFARRMAEASDGAMSAASWADHPQIRVIQVLLLRVRWDDHRDPDSGLFVHGSKVQGIRSSIALVYAEALGLNMLGSNRSTMPEPDLALPAHPCEFRRQMGLRIWSSLEVNFLVSGSRPNIPSDSVGFDVCPDADLSFEQTQPRDHAQTWETAFQEFHLALAVDLSIGIRATGSSRAELSAYEEQTHSQMQAFRTLCSSLPETGLTPLWKDRDCEFHSLADFPMSLIPATRPYCNAEILLPTFSILRSPNWVNDFRMGCPAAHPPECIQVGSTAV